MEQLKPALRILRTKGLSIFDQLILEEILLRKCQSNYFILNNEMKEKDTSIVLGFSGKIAELVNIDRLIEKPIHMIRRYTGGGTVIVDNSTLFASFIMNSKDTPSLPYPRDIMNWSETIYGPIFNKLSAGTNKFALRENDYVLGDCKIGGNAQTITKARWVHHTSFLWDFEPAKMTYLQLPKKRPLYREDRPHASFLTRLSDHVKTVDQLEQALYTQLAASYDLEHVSLSRVNEEVVGLLGGLAADTVARTKIESLETFLGKLAEIPSLIKSGPSCVNL